MKFNALGKKNIDDTIVLLRSMERLIDIEAAGFEKRGKAELAESYRSLKPRIANSISFLEILRNGTEEW